MAARMAVVRFGVFEIDDATGEMRRQGRRVHIAAQPFKTLVLLASRAGDVVSRDELRRHLWGDDTFVEFDRSLNFCVAEIRAALHDDARSPRFIETVPRRGYRFIADAYVVDREGSRGREGQDDRERRRSLAWRRWAAAAVLPLLIAQQPLRPIAHTRATAYPEARAAFERAMTISGQDDAGRRRGIAALKAATRIDPRFAEAYYALAELYLDLALKRELPADAAMVEARVAAERAIALEEAPESHRVLGTIRLVADWDWSGARRELARAVALEPKWDFGFVAYGRVLSAAGDDAGAIAAIDRAETLSPNCDLILFHAGEIYARAGRDDDALDKLERAIGFGPPPRGMSASDWLKQVRSRQFMIHMARRDWPAAHRTAAALVAVSGASEAVQRRFETQDPAVALETFLERSIAMNAAQGPGRRARATHVAALETLRGHPDAALGWLEQAAREHDPDLVYALRDPEFGALRALARYQALDARVRGSSITGGSHSS